LERLRKENEKLREPRLYWDDRCLKSAACYVVDVIADDDPGCIVELRPIHELPTMFVLVQEECEYEVFPTREAAEAARRK
jgi:hypothetical protein